MEYFKGFRTKRLCKGQSEIEYQPILQEVS